MFLLSWPCCQTWWQRQRSHPQSGLLWFPGHLVSRHPCVHKTGESLFVWEFVCFVCRRAPLHCTPHSLLHHCCVETITSCLLLTANSPCFGSKSNLIHNWKWLLRSIWYAFVLLTSVTRAPPGGCSWRGVRGVLFSFFLCSLVSFHPPPPSPTPAPLPRPALYLSPFFDVITIYSFSCKCTKFQFQQKCAFSSCLSLSLGAIWPLPILLPPREKKCFPSCKCVHLYYLVEFASKWDQSFPSMLQTRDTERVSQHNALPLSMPSFFLFP